MLDRSPLGPPDPGDLQGNSSYVDEKLDRLASYLHLEWCVDCADWRPLGHSDQEKQQRAATAARLQEQEQQQFG